MALRFFPLLLASVVLTACNPTVPNRAAPFEPLAGAIALKLKIPAQPGTRAEFTLGQQPLPADTDPSDGYAVVIDTLDFANGLHILKVRVLGAGGQVEQELAHSLLIRN